MNCCNKYLAVVLGLFAAVPATSARTQDNHAFFKGKIIRIVHGAPGGGYADYARLLARHLGNHLAGKPNFVVQGMPGAGGLLAANYLYSQAPQDGTVIGLVQPTAAIAPLFGSKGARFDPLKFHWLGSMDRAYGLCVVWFTSPIKNWVDMLDTPLVVGSSGAGAANFIYPAMLNKLFGTKIKIVGGYKSGTEIFLAMERGEVEGRCDPQLNAIKLQHPDWLALKKIRVPILISDKRSSEFPDAPAIFEFAKNEFARQQLKLFFITQDLHRPFLLPPGVGGDRVRELRAAFDLTLNDPALQADARKANLHLDPVTGTAVAKVLSDAYAIPAEIVQAVRNIVGDM